MKASLSCRFLPPLIRRALSALAFFLLACLFPLPAAIAANQPPGVRYLVVENNGDGAAEFRLTLHPDTLTALYFESPIIISKVPELRVMRRSQSPRMLVLRPRAKGEKLGMAEVFTRAFAAKFRLDLTSKPEDADDVLIVLTRAQMDAWEAKGKAEVERQLAEVRAAHAKELAAAEEELRALRDAKRASDIMQARAITRRMHDHGEAVIKVPMDVDKNHVHEALCPHFVRVITTGHGLPGGKRERYVTYGIYSREQDDVPITAVEVVGANETMARAASVCADSAPDCTGEFVVPAGGYVEGTVLVPDEIPGAAESVSLSFQRSAGIAPLVLAAQQNWPKDWVIKEPISPEEAERRRIEALDGEARGRVGISGVVMFGGIWLANPLDEVDEEDLDVTSMWNVGGRVAYGFNRYLGFEGELVVGWSKQARFDGGMQGELTRSAKLGRGSTGFVLTLGREMIPTFRAGVGLQGISHNARTASGAKIDTDFELEAVWYFGVGIDWRAMEALKMGAFMNLLAEASQVAGVGTRALLLAGVHVTGSWKP